MAKSRMNRRMNRRTKRRQSGGKKVRKTSKKNRTNKQSKQSSLRMKQIRQIVKKIDTKLKKAKRSKRTKRVSSRQDRGGLNKGQIDLLQKFVKDGILSNDLNKLMDQINRIQLIGSEESKLLAAAQKKFIKILEQEKTATRRVLEEQQTNAMYRSQMGPPLLDARRTDAIAKMKEARNRLAASQAKKDAAVREEAKKRREENRKRQKAEIEEAKRQEKLAWERCQGEPFCKHCNDAEGVRCVCNQC